MGKQGLTENSGEINRPVLTEKSRETQWTKDWNSLIQIPNDLNWGMIKELSDKMETCTSKLEPFVKNEFQSWRQLSSLNRQKNEKRQERMFKIYGTSWKGHMRKVWRERMRHKWYSRDDVCELSKRTRNIESQTQEVLWNLGVNTVAMRTADSSDNEEIF